MNRATWVGILDCVKEQVIGLLEIVKESFQKEPTSDLNYFTLFVECSAFTICGLYRSANRQLTDMVVAEFAHRFGEHLSDEGYFEPSHDEEQWFPDFLKILKGRVTYYRSLKWGVPPEGESHKGYFGWEFGKAVGTCCGIERNAMFVTVIQWFAIRSVERTFDLYKHGIQ